MSFLFGLVTMLAGIAGLSLGAILSQELKRKFARVDPVICAVGLFVSAPVLLISTFVVTKSTTICYILLFFGQVALNLNWAIVADILLVRYMSFICLKFACLSTFILYIYAKYFMYLFVSQICWVFDVYNTFMYSKFINWIYAYLN